jgi:hypothetical protein
MNYKEKAESLTGIFYDNIGLNAKTSVEQLKYEAKQCALICVDEIIKVVEDNCLEYDDNYWQQVKTEIEKL